MPLSTHSSGVSQGKMGEGARLSRALPRWSSLAGRWAGKGVRQLPQEHHSRKTRSSGPLITRRSERVRTVNSGPRHSSSKAPKNYRRLRTVEGSSTRRCGARGEILMCCDGEPLSQPLSPRGAREGKRTSLAPLKPGRGTEGEWRIDDATPDRPATHGGAQARGAEGEGPLRRRDLGVSLMQSLPEYRWSGQIPLVERDGTGARRPGLNGIGGRNVAVQIEPLCRRGGGRCAGFMGGTLPTPGRRRGWTM